MNNTTMEAANTSSMLLVSDASSLNAENDSSMYHLYIFKMARVGLRATPGYARCIILIGAVSLASDRCVKPLLRLASPML